MQWILSFTARDYTVRWDGKEFFMPPMAMPPAHRFVLTNEHPAVYLANQARRFKELQSGNVSCEGNQTAEVILRFYSAIEVPPDTLDTNQAEQVRSIKFVDQFDDKNSG